jgi:hypothetical protein
MKAREVYLAADPINAEIAKDMLAGFGIAAHVRHQHLWGGMGELPANLYPSVWVDNEADFEAARDLIKALERGPVRRARAWTCPQCGERLFGQFDRCWRCGALRSEE